MTELQKQAVELYQSGMSLSQVAKAMGRCSSTVEMMIKRAGVARRPAPNRDVWDGRKDEILFLYNQQDMSQEQIAEYFGSHLALIQKVMKRLGIKSKSKGRRRGKQHHQYKHGKSSRLYRTVITKDKCRLCETTEDLGIHHKNDDHYDNRLENLEVLCNSCHMRETKRKWWAAKKAGLPTPKSNAPTGWKPGRKDPRKGRKR